jgi:hypothetical protein
VRSRCYARWETPRPKNSVHGQKIALTAIIDQTNNFAARARTKPAVPPTLSEGDESVFGADAGRVEDIPHNGSSGFGGNAASGEMTDLAAVYGSMYSRI